MPFGVETQTLLVKHLPVASAQPLHASADGFPAAQYANEQSEQSGEINAASHTTAAKSHIRPPLTPPQRSHQPFSHSTPPPPRSLYQPWHPFCTLQWYITQSPSIRSGLTPAAITASHQSTWSFVSILSQTLRYPFYVLECGMAFYHRFFARRSIAEYDVRRVAAVCVYLASKTEDAPRRLIDIVQYMVQYYEAAIEMEVEEQEEKAEPAENTAKPAKDVKPDKVAKAAKAVKADYEEKKSTGQPTVERSSALTAATARPAALPSSSSPSPFATYAHPVDHPDRERPDRLTPREHELRTLFTVTESEVPTRTRPRLLLPSAINLHTTADTTAHHTAALQCRGASSAGLGGGDEEGSVEACGADWRGNDGSGCDARIEHVASFHGSSSLLSAVHRCDVRTDGLPEQQHRRGASAATGWLGNC